MTPTKAIQMKCLDCCCGDKNEVVLCTVKSCPLFNFRKCVKEKQKRNLTDEQKKAAGERMKKARESKNK